MNVDIIIHLPRLICIQSNTSPSALPSLPSYRGGNCLEYSQNKGHRGKGQMLLQQLL